MTAFTRRDALKTLAAAAAASVAASGLAAPALASGRKIVVGALPFTSHAASFVALRRGYFAEAGLDVELKFFQAAQPMAVAIASRDVDYAVTAISGGLISLAQKGAVKVIGGSLSEEPGIEGQKILASNSAYEAGLTSPSQLNGRSFGMTTAGSSFHYMGAKVAAAESAQLHFKPLQKVGAVIGALKTGQIDAWSIVPHIAAPLIAADAVKEIGRISDYLPDYQVTTAFTSTAHASDDKEMTKDFLAAFARGAADYNAAMIEKTADEAAMVALIHEFVYADRPLEKAAPSIIAGTMRLNEGAALNLGSVRDQLDWFKAEGLVDASVALTDLVDDSYVEIRGA